MSFVSPNAYVENYLTIGTENQTVTDRPPLVIGSSQSQSLLTSVLAGISYFGPFNGFQTSQSPNPNTYQISIQAVGSILSNTSIIAYSDKRIKTNIHSLSTEESLNKIRELKPSCFEYIDKIKKSPNKQIGFIAQDVKNIIDESVGPIRDMIPNIFDLADVKDGNIITLRTKTTDLFFENESGSPIKLFLNDKTNKTIETLVEKIIDEKTFKITNSLVENEIFVNGQEVENLLVLEKDVIFTHTTAALKELDSIVQNQQNIINNLESRLSKLESKI